MSTNLTAHFNNAQVFNNLYLKATLKENFETYGATCCGSLAKTRDPCAGPSPTAIPTAPKDTKYFVTLTISMPYSKVSFGVASRDNSQLALYDILRCVYRPSSTRRSRTSTRGPWRARQAQQLTTSKSSPSQKRSAARAASTSKPRCNAKCILFEFSLM